MHFSEVTRKVDTEAGTDWYAALVVTALCKELQIFVRIFSFSFEKAEGAWGCVTSSAWLGRSLSCIAGGLRCK